MEMTVLIFLATFRKSLSGHRLQLRKQVAQRGAAVHNAQGPSRCLPTRSCRGPLAWVCRRAMSAQGVLRPSLNLNVNLGRMPRKVNQLVVGEGIRGVRKILVGILT